MRFMLIDRVLEVERDDAGRPVRAVAIKHVTAAEEYLADHFPEFPILPGVFMLEALVQTARHIALARDSAGADAPGVPTPSGGGATPMPWVLGSARAVKYGAMVPPGSTLRLEVELQPDQGAGLGGDHGGVLEFKGVGVLLGALSGQSGGAAGQAAGEARTAVSGRFSLRRARVD